MSRHLTELRSLVGRPVQTDEILSLEETEVVRVQSTGVIRAQAWREEIRFAEKAESRFLDLVRAIGVLNPSLVYIWTPLSNICGLLRPVMMNKINFAFDFGINADGVLSIITEDFQNELLFDFFEDESGEEMLDIRVSGKHWGAVKY